MHHVVGGRYGLGSKDFTPAMAKAVFDNLKADKPKDKFTVSEGPCLGKHAHACVRRAVVRCLLVQSLTCTMQHLQQCLADLHVASVSD